MGDRYIDRQTDRQTDGWMDRQMDGWIDRQMHIQIVEQWQKLETRQEMAKRECTDSF